MNPKTGIAGRIARAAIHSPLTPLFVLFSLMVGAFAIWKTPREEEPQIVVPMLDVIVSMPGSEPQEVEQRISIPLERLLRQIPNVEYVYSISRPGSSLLIVRFLVGSSQENALVQTYNKLYANLDLLPPGVAPPVIQARSIDDVPILALTLWGKNYNAYQLRQIAAALKNQVKQTDNVSEVNILGGQRRQLRVVLSPEKLAAYNLSPGQIFRTLQSANARAQAGSFASTNQQFLVDAGRLLSNATDVQNTVVSVYQGHPVFLRDVAKAVTDGPEEPANYVFFANAAGAKTTLDAPVGVDMPAVTLTVAKRKGTNATLVANHVLERLQQLRGTVIPEDVTITTTRNYGETAKEKSDALLEHLLLAILSVTLLIAVALGWRESGVVLLTIPVTLAFTLAIFYFYGYTLNRVTLFALIFSIGILVDDAIVVVENIVRHFRLPSCQDHSLSEVAVGAVDEVGNPTILATFTVVASILPMAFVRGLMGPYMRPIPVGASAAMLLSLLVAFVLAPWASLRLLHHTAKHAATQPAESEWIARLYRRGMQALIVKPRTRYLFLGSVVLLLLLSVALIPLKLVKVKMLPFDNKNEFQVIVNMPDGSTLEQTTRLTQTLGAYLAQQPEILNYQIYAGTSGPYNFNGLVRHYFLRQQPNQADIQVNLLPKEQRSLQSHAIARRIRPELDTIAAPFGARIAVSEVPPGPPVLQTLVAEIYGPDMQQQTQIAQQVKQIFQQTPGVVDVDWYVEDPQTQYDLRVDPTKAALAGVDATQVANTLTLALHGMDAGLLHVPSAVESIPIHVQLDREDRSSIDQLQNIKLPTANGGQVSLSEVTQLQKTTLQPSIYRKNMRRVIYVTGDMAGGAESPVYAILKMNRALDQLHLPQGYKLERYNAVQPDSTLHYAMKWDGEWQVTIEVFRDLGIAFLGSLLLIYVLVVGWFRSFLAPLLIMAPIPLTLIGILPAHALTGAFFTATSMIGFIAGAGIIVRNSIILVDFIGQRREEGLPLAEAVIDAGAVRLRPILLTAAAVILGASAILSDPIFQGLALSLMAGGVASTLLSCVTVPLLYYMVEKRAHDANTLALAHAVACAPDTLSKEEKQ